jgi:hypothetical protein
MGIQTWMKRKYSIKETFIPKEKIYTTKELSCDQKEF